jgi:hypothetical protein
MALFVSTAFAAGHPWRAAEPDDLAGTWRQVGVVLLVPGLDRNDPWYSAKQFFRFPAGGGLKHVLVNPDRAPSRHTPTQGQRHMLENAPTVQHLTWRTSGIAILKHPERPPQRVDLGLYLRDAPTGPKGGAIEPRKGDLILAFYSYKDPNVAMYYRLLRRLP